MANPFKSSLLKIERANHHIEDIERLIASLPDTYTAEIETDSKTAKERIKYGFVGVDQIGEQIALIIGDAIHNLRTSIEYAWIAVLQRHVPSAVDKFSKFPVRTDRQEVESALKGKKIDISCPALYERIVSDIQPYSTGNDFICRLHDLDISDKHWLLTPVLNYGVARFIALKNKETGEILRGDTWAETRPSPWYVNLPEGKWQVEDKGHLSVKVVFGDVESMKGLEIIPELRSFSKLCLNIVHRLDKL